MKAKKTKDIGILYLEHIKNAVADCFSICSGISKTHVEAIAKTMIEAIYRQTSGHSQMQKKPRHQSVGPYRPR